MGKQPVTERFEKNEIIRPAIAGWYFVLAVVFLICSLSLIIAPAQAMTITMSNPGGMAERDIVVYYGNNGTMQGFYNSTSTIDLDANASYLFMLKPIQTNPFDDPSDWFVNSFIPAVTSNALALVFIAFLLGYMYTRR